jgi:hypothetical protein
MNTNDIIAACREIQKMDTIMNNNIAVCRETQNRRFIRDPKSHKKQLKMTRDNKSHKKVLTEKVSKAISKKQAVKEKKVPDKYSVPCEYSIPEPKPVKTVLQQPKKSLGKVRSNENLLACLEDIERAEEDAFLDILEIEAHNMLSEYFKDVADQQYQGYLREKEELNCNDNLSEMERIQKQDYCEWYEKKMRTKKDTHLTLEEYVFKREQERERWAFCKSHGMTRKMFDDTLDYEKNVKALEDEIDPENIEELTFKIWTYEQNLDKWVQDETSKMDDWFNNFAENNPDFVQKIQERNYCLQETIIQAMG